MEEIITATQTELAAAFNEWERRYCQEPYRFQSEASKLLKETPETYGAACAPYLVQILNEQKNTWVKSLTQPSPPAGGS